MRKLSERQRRSTRGAQLALQWRSATRAFPRDALLERFRWRDSARGIFLERDHTRDCRGRLTRKTLLGKLHWRASVNFLWLNHQAEAKIQVRRTSNNMERSALKEEHGTAWKEEQPAR